MQLRPRTSQTLTGVQLEGDPGVVWSLPLIKVLSLCLVFFLQLEGPTEQMNTTIISVLTSADRQRTIEDLLALQQADGGWSLPLLCREL